MTEEVQVKGIIFDLDGTLYYLRRTRVRLTLALWRHIGVVVHLGTARRWVRSRTFADQESLAAAYACELGRRAKIPPERAAAWYDEVFFDAFIDLLDRKARPRPGLHRLLAELRSRGVKLAVVSDYGRVDERLRAVGLPPEAFDITLTTEELGQLKPSPAAFLHVAQRWGLDPRSIVVVGDHVERDAEAARAAFMGAIIVDNRPPLFGRRKKNGVTLVTWKDAARDLATRTGAHLE